MKFFLYFIVLLTMLSCECNNEEKNRFLINNADKAYLVYADNEVKFVDQHNEEIIAYFGDPYFYLEQNDIGLRACSYDTEERGTQNINIGIYKGIINLTHYPQLNIDLNDGLSYNYFNITNQKDNRLDLNLQNVEIQGMQFKDVLVLENSNKEGEYKIEKVIYSKVHGIELILFKDGTWYKRLE